MVEVTGWLGEVLPGGMVWKTRVFYSECAKEVSPRSLQVTKAEGKWPSDQGLTRNAAEGTPHGISIWTNWPVTFSSNVPWAWGFHWSAPRSPFWESCEKQRHLSCPGWARITQPWDPKQGPWWWWALTGYLSTFPTDHRWLKDPHLVLSYLQLVFSSPLLNLINPEDKLHKYVISHWCSICLF